MKVRVASPESVHINLNVVSKVVFASDDREVPLSLIINCQGNFEEE